MAVEGMGAGDAEKYVAIINSFNLGRSVIRRHHLIGYFLSSDNPSLAQFDSSRHLQWLAYRALQGRMKCEFSPRHGNITIELQDTDPASAETMMTYIVDDFWELLRQKQLRDVKVAVKSLEEEEARTPDPMIGQALYQLIVTQIQREKMAAVESDFAFMVIEPPSARDSKVWPPTLLLCLLAAMGTFAMVATYILFIHPSPLGQKAALLLRGKAQEPFNSDDRRQPVIADAARGPVP